MDVRKIDGFLPEANASLLASKFSVSVAVGRPVNTVLGASTHASMVEAVDVGVSRCTAEHGVAPATSPMSYIMLRWRSGGVPPVAIIGFIK